MTRDTIVQMWESEGAKLSGHAIAVREDRDATCFIETQGEVMVIARLTKVELHDTFLTLQTAKDERFVFAYEDVLGFKLAAIATPKDRPAGFGSR